MKNKIAIVLPYKEIYSDNFAGAASIWVKDYFSFSKLSKDTVIYGNLDKGLKPLTDNFKNINISSKSFSKTKEYINFFYKDHLKNNFDIIEIHNRPEYLNYLIKKKINSKLIFFFHNNPKDIRGSKTIKERLNILEKTETIIQIPRFFTVYGPYGRPDMSILRFIHWIYNDEDLILYGDGNQKRSFTYISDIVNGLTKILNFEKSGTFNFGSNQTWSLNDVIKIIENNLDKKAKISYQERAYKDVDVVLPSLEISKDLLNWEPKVNVEDGIKNTVEWYLEHSSILKNIKFKYDYEQ